MTKNLALNIIHSVLWGLIWETFIFIVCAQIYMDFLVSRVTGMKGRMINDASFSFKYHYGGVIQHSYNLKHHQIFIQSKPPL